MRSNKPDWLPDAECRQHYSSHVEERLHSAGYVLPDVSAQGDYLVATTYGCMVQTAGHLSRQEAGVIRGTARDESDLDLASSAAEIAVLRAIASLRCVVPSLDDIQKIIIMRGYINSSSSFTEHTAALNRASKILMLAFGESAGRHARAALGVSSLPSGGMVEIELCAEVRPDAKTDLYD